MFQNIKSSSGLSVAFILLLFLSFCLVYSCSQTEDEARVAAGHPDIRTHQFVGDQVCQSCHAGEWEQWKGSHHDYAIAEANENYVRGDFEDAGFTDGDDTYRFYRQGEYFYVEISTEGGMTETHRIEYTFGWEPLQQYLVDIGRGKLQALHAAWDTEQERWFSLHPDETYPDDDWMHWRGGSMNWNTMCADCHSTNLRQNYIAEADSFHTEWSVINVSCESCHGPGEDHVQFVNSPEGEEASRERIGEDLILGRFTPQIEEINTCAPCHSLRQQLTDDYIHGDYFLDHFEPTLPHPDQYYADGQILGEVFEYASFLQSRMYAEGVQCTDCHNPHSLQLRQPLTDNQLCMSCHEPEYNTIDHHFHEPNTEASQCINCHMTGRYFMGNDFRRDHSFRVPRPDQSAQFGTPNACNDCHGDRSAEWAALAVEEWYGQERPAHYSDALLKADAGQTSQNIDLRELIFDAEQPEIIRATAVWYVGRYPGEDAAEILGEAIQSDSPMIRTSAARAMEHLSPEIRLPLLEGALADSVRSVRIAAGQQLTGFALHDLSPDARDPFENAMQEYRAYLEINRYFPQGQMNLARYYEDQGEAGKAMDAYRGTLERDPYFTPARVNLAYLHNSIGENDQAEELLRTVIDQEPEFGDAYYSLALLLAEEQRMEEAIGYFEQAAELLAGQSRVFYNLAIANQTVNRPQQAEAAYLQAIELDPQNGDYRYGLITLYMQQNQHEQALEQAEELDQLYPNNPQIEQLLDMIRREL
jgi:predicted CXXCH cytochrome family protein